MYEHYCGSYQLIRIFPYVNTNELLSGNLRIGFGKYNGIDCKPFECVLDYKYKTSDVQIRRFMFGTLIIHGSTSTILLSDHASTYFLLYIDFRDSGEPGSNFAGIMLTDTRGKDLASAWPFYAHRLDDSATCPTGVLMPENVPKNAMRHLQRGIIHWNIAKYPGFPIKRPDE